MGECLVVSGEWCRGELDGWQLGMLSRGLYAGIESRHR